MKRDLTLHSAPNFIDGLLIQTAGLSDLLLVVAAGSCIQEQVRATMLQHDRRSRIAGPGAGRVWNTGQTECRSILGGIEPVREAVRQALDSVPGVGVVAISERPHVMLAGDIRSDMAGELEQNAGIPVLWFSPGELNRDSEDALAAFARAIAGRAPSQPSPVVGSRTAPQLMVAGYRYHRGEGDCQGDVEELRRLVRGIGFRPGPVWYSGGGWGDLWPEPGSLLATLPLLHGHLGGLADRLSLREVTVPMPVGGAGTREWLERLLPLAPDRKAAGAFVEEEIGRLADILVRAVPRSTSGLRCGIVVEPEWVEPLARFFEEELEIEVPVRLHRQRAPLPGCEGESDSPDRRFDPSFASLDHHLSAAWNSGPLDFLVCSSWEKRMAARCRPEVRCLEFGYPSDGWHPAARTPALGIEGALAWVDRIACLTGRG